MARFERRRFGGFRESRESGFGLPKPINVGEKYDVEISGVGSRGDGITKIKDFVVFVPNTKTGDKVKIEIKEVRNRFATGEKVGEAGAVEEAPKAEEAPAEEVEEAPAEEPAEEVAEEAPAEEVEEAPAEEPAEEVAETEEVEEVVEEESAEEVEE